MLVAPSITVTTCAGAQNVPCCQWLPPQMPRISSESEALGRMAGFTGLRLPLPLGRAIPLTLGRLAGFTGLVILMATPMPGGLATLGGVTGATGGATGASLGVPGKTLG